MKSAPFFGLKEMATQSSSAESACQVEESHQEKPKPRPAAKVGFDCEFVERPPKAVQADCPVCLLVLHQPHQVTCCGYAFCRVCIERIQTDKKSCPTCNQKDFTVFPDLRLQRSLYEFCIWCSHKTECCEWSGELSQLEKHLNESPKLDEQLVGCQFTDVECHHCCELFQRRYVTAHQIGQCIRRPFSCDYCGNYGADFEDVTTKHWPVCGSRPVPCPNDCGVYPERQNLEHHVSKDCPLTVVNCDFHYAGCEIQLPRKDMPAHLAENLVIHVSQLAIYSHTLSLKTQALENALAEKESEIAELKAQQLYGVFPIEFVMSEFDKYKKDDIWYSGPFYTHHRGYKMCLKVFPNNEGSSVDIGVCLMRGGFDKQLKWPFQGKVTVKVINQVQDKEHYTETVDFNSASGAAISCLRVTNGERAPKGRFNKQVLTHSDLNYNPGKNCQLLMDNCLSFRVTRVTNVGLDQITQLEKQCLAIESHDCMTPFEFSMRNVEQQKAENDHWYSPSFYTHPRGYRMCLSVDANGYGNDVGTSVSVFVCLMRGKWDNYLKWPFKGDVTIQLLNQIEDKGHYEKILDFTDDTPDDVTGRMTTRERAVRWGWRKFISHNALNYDQAKNCQYLKYDSLHFRIVKVKLV